MQKIKCVRTHYSKCINSGPNRTLFDPPANLTLTLTIPMIFCGYIWHGALLWSAFWHLQKFCLKEGDQNWKKKLKMEQIQCNDKKYIRKIVNRWLDKPFFYPGQGSPSGYDGKKNQYPNDCTFFGIQVWTSIKFWPHSKKLLHQPQFNILFGGPEIQTHKR